MVSKQVFYLLLLLNVVIAVRINFTNCQTNEWNCLNDVPNDITYSCSEVTSEEFIVHLKDYYTDHITTVTVHGCKDIKVVLDCPLLRKPSRLQHFIIKDCDKLQFTQLSNSSLLQTPPELTIENVKEITSLPTGLLKSPLNISGRKCLGTSVLKGFHIKNSTIKSIEPNSIYNVTGMKIIEFENVFIKQIKAQSIDAIMGKNDSIFIFNNCKIDVIETKAITVLAKSVILIGSTVDDINSNAINITSESVQIQNNILGDIKRYALEVKSSIIDITNNIINSLKTNALANIKCSKKRISRRRISILNNKIHEVEPYSLFFNYSSCKNSATQVNFLNNKINCHCEKLSFLHSNNKDVNNELKIIITNPKNNNTCMTAPCYLPIDVINTLIEKDMCKLNLNEKVKCLIYHDRSYDNIKNLSSEEDATESNLTFYLIWESKKGDGSRSNYNHSNYTRNRKPSIDTNNIIKEGYVNTTNKTEINVMFDPTRDFEESLRSASARPIYTDARNNLASEEQKYRCYKNQCNSTGTYHKEQALDFYKYVLSQLRMIRPSQHDV